MGRWPLRGAGLQPRQFCLGSLCPPLRPPLAHISLSVHGGRERQTVQRRERERESERCFFTCATLAPGPSRTRCRAELQRRRRLPEAAWEARASAHGASERQEAEEAARASAGCLGTAGPLESPVPGRWPWQRAWRPQGEGCGTGSCLRLLRQRQRQPPLLLLLLPSPQLHARATLSEVGCCWATRWHPS